MPEIHRGIEPQKSRTQWEAPMQATVEVLEVIASEHPDLLAFQVHVLTSGTMSFAVQKLAAIFDVPLDELGSTVTRACHDLDRLEKYRGVIGKLTKILPSPNLPALVHLCRARLKRAQQAVRQRRLERILRKLERSYDFARARAWIDDFIGPLPAESKEGETDDR